MKAIKRYTVAAHGAHVMLVLGLLTTVSGCSLKTYAINMVGDALATGDSVYESDEDLELVGQALPFGLKLTESLLVQSPEHRGLLQTACRGFVLYSYAFVDYEAQLAVDVDLDRARALRLRARKLYLRAFDYCIRGLERDYDAFGAHLAVDADSAVHVLKAKHRERDLPLNYWTAASLGLAISVSRDDAALLARLPDVEALLDRALELDESWDDGALHEFKVIFAGAKQAPTPLATIKRHYRRALALSNGENAGVHLAYAEAVSVPAQDSAEFRTLVEQALEVNPDRRPEDRLVNLLAHRRAHWLATRVDDLIVSETPVVSTGGTEQ